MPLGIPPQQYNPNVADIWASLPYLPDLNGTEPIVEVIGELSRVLLTKTMVVKIPTGSLRDARAAANFESEIVSRLHDLAIASPLALPYGLDDCGDIMPGCYSVFSRVAGEVLDKPTVQRFSPAEKRQMGHQIGRFVAWMGSEFSLELYDEIFSYHKPPIWDCAAKLQNRADKQQFETLDYNLAEILLDLQDEFKDNDELQHPKRPIVGHDDLDFKNLTFMPGSVGWEQQGVFDFGLTKHSSAERELRFLETIGDIAVAAAMESYEASTGQRLQRDLITFWARAHTAATYSYLLSSGEEELFGLLQQYEDDLRILYPDFEPNPDKALLAYIRTLNRPGITA